MAADDVRTEFHLTPDGWVTGTRKYFGRPTGTEVPRPNEAFVTFEHQEIDSSHFGPTRYSVEEIWRGADTTDEHIRDQLKQHGPPEAGNWAGTRPWQDLPRRYKG